MLIFLIFFILIFFLTKYNVISESSVQSSPKYVSMSLHYSESKRFCNKFTYYLFIFINLYSAYSVLTLYMCLCSFVLLFILETFAFMDIDIIFSIYYHPLKRFSKNIFKIFVSNTSFLP